MRRSGAAWQDAVAAARDLGRQPEDRLRWLLDFIQRDDISSERASAQLYAFATSSPARVNLMRDEPHLLTQEVIRLRQGELRTAIGNILRGPGWQLQMAPGVSRLVFRRRRGGVVSVLNVNSLQAALAMVSADLFEALGDRIQACDQCRRLFFREKNQKRCALAECQRKAQAQRLQRYMSKPEKRATINQRRRDRYHGRKAELAQ